MRLVTTKINCEVKYKKVSENTVAQKPAIILRDSNGKKVEKKRVTLDGEILEGYHWKLFNEDGEVDKSDVHYFHVQEDGEEVEVRPFDRTKEIKIIQEVPAAIMTEFLEASVYELFHTEDSIVDVLYEEAERYVREDLVGIALFSWGRGFQQYYAIVYPVLRDGKFVWVMKLTQAKIEYSHLMEVPITVKKPVAQPPTLKTLPPVKAIIAK